MIDSDTANSSDSLLERVRQKALHVGFARVGVAHAEPLTVEAERLQAWLRAGRHGAMDWMERTADVRTNINHGGMLPSAKSVIVLAAPYARSAAHVGPTPGRIARYARGRDYHTVLYRRGRKVADVLREAGHIARVSVDSMPVFERAWAERAGLGFIGKNACLIIPGLGSHVFLTAIVTTAELPASERMPERCGQCTLCLDGCPTRAFVAPRELDARRCISYLTIESEEPVPLPMRPALSDWVFGCDVCQDVCPFNKTALPDESITHPFSDERWNDMTAERVLRMSEGEFTSFAEGTPIKRAGYRGFARNVLYSLGNRGMRVHLPIVREARANADSEMVRDAADWALAQIEGREAED